MTKFWHRSKSNIGNCEIGKGSVVHSHVWIGDGVRIGKKVKIQAFAFIPSGVSIGDACFIGPHVCFINDKYPPAPDWEAEETIVEDGARIGANSTILCGIRIGGGAMVGAGSVVTRSIPRGETWCGNPAKKI